MNAPKNRLSDDEEQPDRELGVADAGVRLVRVLVACAATGLELARVVTTCLRHQWLLLRLVGLGRRFDRPPVDPEERDEHADRERATSS